MIKFSTDYHLGSTLNMHTTHASRAALRDALYTQALKVTESICTPHYLAGDLVDTYRNDESIIKQALEILTRVSNCIMGNHDQTNRKDTIGTMALLEPLVDIVPAVMNKCEPTFITEETAFLVVVPHTNTQELFERCLEDLTRGDEVDSKYYKWSEICYPKILMLHCNYDHPWEMTETTLNLTPELAEKLLEVFDYILIGHEHNHREDFGGRLILMGNIHPTNFGDISDKYSWHFENGKMHKTLIWGKKKHYAEVSDPQSISELTLDSDKQFVKIVGSVNAADYPNYCKSLTKLWKNNEHCYAIRSAVEIINASGAAELDTEALKNLTETIQEEIRGDKEMSKLFKELMEESNV